MYTHSSQLVQAEQQPEASASALGCRAMQSLSSRIAIKEPQDIQSYASVQIRCLNFLIRFRTETYPKFPDSGPTEFKA